MRGVVKVKGERSDTASRANIQRYACVACKYLRHTLAQLCANTHNNFQYFYKVLSTSLRISNALSIVAYTVCSKESRKRYGGWACGVAYSVDDFHAGGQSSSPVTRQQLITQSFPNGNQVF